jgi:hypothetical protein
MAEAPPGGPGPSGWATRWGARISRTATGSSTVAITRSRPPAGSASRTNGHFGAWNCGRPPPGHVGIGKPAGRDRGRRNWPFVRRPVADYSEAGGRSPSVRAEAPSGHGKTPRKAIVQRRSNPVGDTNPWIRQ